MIIKVAWLDAGSGDDGVPDENASGSESSVDADSEFPAVRLSFSSSPLRIDTLAHAILLFAGGLSKPDRKRAA